jgi:hypothetical protein
MPQFFSKNVGYSSYTQYPNYCVEMQPIAAANFQGSQWDLNDQPASTIANDEEGRTHADPSVSNNGNFRVFSRGWLTVPLPTSR